MTDKILKINEAILERLNGIGECRTHAKIYGLAEPVFIRDKESEKTAPAIVGEDGECYDVVGDCDLYDVTCYHRLQSKNYQARSGYGSRPSYLQAADMSLIVYGKRKSFSQFDVEKAVCVALAGSDDVEIVSSDFNAIQVFGTEYSGFPFILNPDYFLLKINYRITSIFDVRCVK